MGNYRCRKPGFLSAMQMAIVEATWAGRSNEWIYTNIYCADPKDKDAMRAAKNKLSGFRNSNKFKEYYKSLMTEARVRGYGKALNQMIEDIENPNPWVRIQAANTVLTHTAGAVIDEQERTVSVKIEGMPAIGVPPAEETDALPNADRLILNVGEVIEETESSVV